MTNRAPIERWSRGELEDRFHSVADTLSTLKQTNNRLEREVKILNGRLSGRHSQQRTMPNGPRKSEMEELHRSNEIMALKLKVLKHQLLNYTKVNSSTSLTGRYRPTTATAQRQQQKSRSGQRPQSAVVVSSSGGSNQTKGMPLVDQSKAIGDQPLNQSQTMPSSAIGQQINPRKRPISQPAIEEHYEYEESEGQFEAISRETGRAEQRNGFGILEEDQIENEIKEKLREMQRQNRKLTDDNEELQFSLDKSEKRLSALRNEYDRVVRELSQAQREIRSQSDSMNSEREDAQRRVDGSVRNAEIADCELAIAREECRTLRKAHERLVEKALQQENSGKATLEELGRLRAKLQQNANERETERREWGEERQRLRKENAKLREAREQETREVQRKEREEQRESSDSIEQQRRRGERENQSIIIGDESKREKSDKNGKTKRRNDDGNGNHLLNKLFTDVIGIVDSHLESRKEMEGEGVKFPIGNGNLDERWQQMYEDVYFELGKVRKLLLSEHGMNVQLREEKGHLSAELEFAKMKSEKQLAELKDQLEERGKQIAVLENELEYVAKSGQLRHTVLSNSTVEKGKDRSMAADERMEKASSIEPTEMTLQIQKVVLTEEAIRQAHNPCPMLFLAIEFFDFEIQTTKVTNGPEATFDFTAVFDTPISDLFIHYIQTEGMDIELYSVKDGLSYELWSKANIPLKKLLSIQTPTHFHGELKFRALSRGPSAENQQKEQTLLLATAFYSIQVPFSFLRALNAQRRRMVATAMIPIGKGDQSADESFNELIVQIHRCANIERLKGDVSTDESKKARNTKPSTYVAYEFFNFPVHMTQTVRESWNPVFDDQQSWRVPADSEAVHEYLKQKDLLLYLIDEGTDDGIGQTAPKARVLASINLPLFPLARNHKIRDTFPLLDRANESIISEASIDVSIYWKFAYVFNGLENLRMEEKVPLKIFTPPVIGQNESKENEEQQKSTRPTDHFERESDAKAISRRKNEMEQPKDTHQKEKEGIGKRGPSAEDDNSIGGSEKAEAAEQSTRAEEGGHGEGEMPEQELRRRLLLLPEPTKKSAEETHTERNGQSQGEEAATSEANQSKTSVESGSDDVSTPKSSRSSATIVVDTDREKAIERTATSDEVSEDLLKDGTFLESNAHANDGGEEDDVSIRSDATYTAEGPLGPIEMDEPRVTKGEEDEEKVEFIQAEEGWDNAHANNGQATDEQTPPSPKTTVAPVAAPRRSLFVTKHPAPLPPPSTTELLTAKKAVDFAEPLHSSIPPSDVSSSFAEDTTLGSSRSSNSSEANGRTASADQQHQMGEEGQEKERKKQRTKQRTKAPVEIAPAPATPAIRIRPESDSKRTAEVVDGLSNVLVSPNSAKVEIRVGKLRLLDHSSLPIDSQHFGEGCRVFVEWNFLDFSREQCVTEGAAEMPRLPMEAVNFDHRSDYELDQKRIALLSQWTELNIRLTFTLVVDQQQGANDDLDDLCMGELDLLDVLDTATHSLLMRTVDNLSVAMLEVDIVYSDNLLEYMREAMREIMGDESEGASGDDDEDHFELLGSAMDNRQGP